MLLLGIESSCDETAASVVENCTTLRSSVIASQAMEHRKYGGVVPELASRRHCENILATVQQALDEAGVTVEMLDGVAVTYTPGLIGALLVGVNFAKGLAYAAGKPLIPVHHIAGHIAANYLAHPALKPPYLCLVVIRCSWKCRTTRYSGCLARQGTMQPENALTSVPGCSAIRIRAVCRSIKLHSKATRRNTRSRSPMLPAASWT